MLHTGRVDLHHTGCGGGGSFFYGRGSRWLSGNCLRRCFWGDLWRSFGFAVEVLFCALHASAKATADDRSFQTTSQSLFATETFLGPRSFAKVRRFFFQRFSTSLDGRLFSNATSACLAGGGLQKPFGCKAFKRGLHHSRSGRSSHITDSGFIKCLLVVLNPLVQNLFGACHDIRRENSCCCHHIWRGSQHALGDERHSFEGVAAQLFELCAGLIANALVKVLERLGPIKQGLELLLVLYVFFADTRQRHSQFQLVADSLGNFRHGPNACTSQRRNPAKRTHKRV